MTGVLEPGEEAAAPASRRAVHEPAPKPWAALAVALIAGVGLFALAVRSLYVGQGQSYDSLLYARSLWGIGHGVWHNPAYGTHAFGIHANVVLLLLAPLTWLLPAALVLAAAQATAFAATLSVVARRAGPDALLAVALAVLSPLLMNPWLFDLRPGPLAVPLLAAALLRLRARGALDLRVGLLVIGATLVREEFAVVAAAGLVLAPLGRRDLALRIAVGAGLLAYMALYWFVLRDLFSGGAAARADQAAVDLVAGGEGAVTYRIALAAALAASGGGLVWLGWRWLGAALPGIGVAVLLAKQPEHALSFHYTMFAAPGLLVALVDGLGRLRERTARAGGGRAAWVAGAVLLALAATHAFGALPGGRRFQADAFGFDADARGWQRAVHEEVARWPEHEGALAPGPFAAAAADRPTIYSVETATRHVAEQNEAPPGLAVALLPTHEWERLGRWLVHRGGWQLEGLVADRFALLRAGSIGDPNPLLAGAPETAPPCAGPPDAVWPAAGLAACRVTTPDGERVALLRVGSASGEARALAVELLRDGQVAPARILHGLVNPAQVPARRWVWLELPVEPQEGDRIRVVDDLGRTAPAMDPERPDAPAVEAPTL